jgi:hypothetical protein
MANSNRIITTRSNYTLKEKKQDLGSSAIYERDYMLTSSLTGFDSWTIPYGDSNFKIITPQAESRKKKHKNGEWLRKNECTVTLVDNCEVWTLSDLVDTEVSTENRIIRKPDYSTLLDFVYFGSCVELIKTAMSDIIKKYPGELYVTTNTYDFISGSEQYRLGYNILDNPVVVDNPFNIDLLSLSVAGKEENPDFNELRYFASSFKKYMLLDNEEHEMACLEGWEVNAKNKKCFRNGDLYATIVLTFSDGGTMEIYSYYMDGGNILITDSKFSGYRLRPRASEVSKVFNEDFIIFENFLLNRNSQPIYTISIDSPYEGAEGIVHTIKSYTWPTLYGWNIDVQSPDYNRYVNNLLAVADFYDTNMVDNLWRNLIHDAIKNMDITAETFRKTGDDSSDYIIGTGNIRGLMLAYGRQFDDIKFDMENIKTMNVITYDENGNMPDYFLSDTLGLSGWEVSSVVETLDNTASIFDLYDGSNKTYTTNDLNTHFMRMLKLNSKAIVKRKGTRNAIETLLSLFGMCSYDFASNYYESLPESSKTLINGKFASWDDLPDETKALYYDYKLNEYVVVASNNETDMVIGDEPLPAEVINEMKDNAFSELNQGGVSGLPVKIVTVNYNQPVSGGTSDNVTIRYLIPWFDKKIGLDGNPYFQMYGGWIKSENGDYDETLQYLNVVARISDLITIQASQLYDGRIYYVDDITDIGTYYTGDTRDASHYFRLSSTDYSNRFTDNMYGDGWYNIPQGDIDNDRRYGMQVIKLEKIVETTAGNNPHTGYGKYDDGETYLDYFRQIFKGTIDNNQFTDDAYDCETGELLSGITTMGFTLTGNVPDNMKTWFFTDATNPNKIYRVYKKYVDAEDDEGNTYNIPVGYEEASFSTAVNVGKAAYDGKEVFFETELQAFDFETRVTGSNDEAAANSIINVKKMTIEFNKQRYADNCEFKKFLHEAIMPYVKQVIPSTTIFEIINIDSDSYVTGC